MRQKSIALLQEVYSRTGDESPNGTQRGKIINATVSSRKKFSFGNATFKLMFCTRPSHYPCTSAHEDRGPPGAL